MKTPQFWEGRSVIAQILRPASWLYYGMSRLHRAIQMLQKPQHIPAVIVICVGNAVVGGAGKTPLIQHLALKLAQKGHNVHIASKGYGGKRQEKPLKVSFQLHKATECGDEPLMLAERTDCPVWVCHYRQDAIVAAAKAGADIVLCDDGLQDPTFHKNKNILVMDRDAGQGNGLLLPAGPLREPLRKALSRTDCIVLTGASDAEMPASFGNKPHYQARLMPITQLTLLQQKPIFAFAGIGRPEKFFNYLRQHNLQLVATQSFADHYAYQPQDITDLKTQIAQHQAVAVTTAKDAVKLPADFRQQLVILETELQIDNEEALLQWLVN